MRKKTKEMITIRVDEKVLEKYERIAEENGVTKASLFDAALLKYADEWEGEKQITEYIEKNPDNEMAQVMSAFMELKFALDSIARE